MRRELSDPDVPGWPTTFREWIEKDLGNPRQGVLAEALGISRITVGNWLRGSKRPRDRHLETLVLLDALVSRGQSPSEAMASVALIRRGGPMGVGPARAQHMLEKRLAALEAQVERMDNAMRRFLA